MSDITTVTHWKELTLDNQIISMQSGFAFALKNTVTEGIPHLRPFNIGNNGQLDLRKVIFLPKESVNDLQQYQLQPGDILFNNTNSVELVGKSAIINSSMECTFSNHLTRLRVRDANLLDPAWLALHLYIIWRNGFFAEQCHKWIGQAGFNATELASLKIPIPPLKTQQRIIARVETLLADLQEVRNILESMRHDIDQVISGVLMEVFEDSFSSTPGWSEKDVEDLCYVPQYGYTQSATFEPIGPKFLRITDIQNGHVDWNSVPYCQISQDRLSTYLLQKGDILFARSGATTGKTFLVGVCPTAVFASYLIRLRVKEGVLPKLLAWFFKSRLYWDQIQLGGSAQPNMNAQLLKKVRVRYPQETQTQQRIVNYLDSIQEGVDELQEMMREDEEILQQIEQGILNQAFRGEL